MLEELELEGTAPPSPIPKVNQRFYTIDDLTHLPKPTWLIDGLFEANSLVMLAGPPASFKSFMCLDWLLSIAMGRDWNGHKAHKNKVLYVLGEGKSSLLKRVKAWIHYHQPSEAELANLNSNFKITFEVPQLSSKPSVDSFLADLTKESYDPAVIAIDTFARSAVGLDENLQKDTGLWIESAERLRNLGKAVIIVHHTKKNTEMGLQYRGSTVIMGAMDTAMTMYPEKNKSQVVFAVTKQKDHDEGEPTRYNRVIVKPSPEEEGSIVLTPAPFTMDERFTAEGQKEESLINTLLEDPTYESDRARARVLARETQISESAAQARIRRAREA